MNRSAATETRPRHHRALMPIMLRMFPVVFAGLFASSAAHAEPRWGARLGVGTYNLNEDTVVPQGLGRSAFSLGLDAHLVFGNYIRLGAGVFGFSPEDNEEFTVPVMDEYGNISGGQGSAAGAGIFGEAGVTVPLGKAVRSELNLGLLGVTADRSVANCVDCPVEALHIPAGAYIKPRLLC